MEKILKALLKGLCGILDISKVQDDEVGDGTTSVAVLASELLRVSKLYVCLCRGKYAFPEDFPCCHYSAIRSRLSFKGLCGWSMGKLRIGIHCNQDIVNVISIL